MRNPHRLGLGWLALLPFFLFFAFWAGVIYIVLHFIAKFW